MKKMSAWILALVLALTPAAAGCENGAPPAAGEETPAAKVMPLPVDPEELDFSDGRFEVRIDGADLYEQEESLPLMLYVTDLYDAEQIENLAPGDTVLAAGKVCTVERIFIHGAYGLDGGGDTAEEYEVCSEDLGFSYLVFVKASDGKYAARIDDWTPVTYVGTVSVPLPLPESFVFYDYPGGDDPDVGNAADFLELLLELPPAFFSQYNTSAVFMDGLLAEIHNRSYPWGPETEED